MSLRPMGCACTQRVEIGGSVWWQRCIIPREASNLLDIHSKPQMTPKITTQRLIANTPIGEIK